MKLIVKYHSSTNIVGTDFYGNEIVPFVKVGQFKRFIQQNCDKQFIVEYNNEITEILKVGESENLGKEIVGFNPETNEITVETTFITEDLLSDSTTHTEKVCEDNMIFVFEGCYLNNPLRNEVVLKNRELENLYFLIRNQHHRVKGVVKIKNLKWFYSATGKIKSTPIIRYAIFENEVVYTISDGYKTIYTIALEYTALKESAFFEQEIVEDAIYKITEKWTYCNIPSFSGGFHREIISKEFISKEFIRDKIVRELWKVTEKSYLKNNGNRKTRIKRIYRIKETTPKRSGGRFMIKTTFEVETEWFYERKNPQFNPNRG